MSPSAGRFSVFGFSGTHEALVAEQALLDGGFDVALIPTPRSLGSSCGFAVRVPRAARDAAAAALAAAGVEAQGEVEIEDRLGR